MKILITHFYTRDNRGDAAILSALLSEIKRVFKNPDITIATMEDTNKRKTFEDYPTIKSLISQAVIMDGGRLKRWKSMIYTTLMPLLWSFFHNIFKIKINGVLTHDLKKLLSTMTEADLVILVGGGYLRGTGGLGDNINYVFLLYPILLAKMLGKPVVLHSQSIGPFGDSFQKNLSRFVLSKVDLIVTREDISTQLLKDMKIPSEKIKRSVDAGFLFESDKKVDLKNYGIVSNGKETVGITVARKWLNNKKLQSHYEEEIAKFADHIIAEKDVNIVFIPQVTSPLFDDDDRDVAKRIVEKMKQKKFVWIIDKELSHYEIKALYSQLQYIIGTRFHSVIFSLTSYVPAIAIEYEHKTRGIMKDLHLLDWVIKLEDLTAEKLIAKFDALTEQKEKYIRSLKSQIPAYVSEARMAVQTIKEVLESKK